MDIPIEISPKMVFVCKTDSLGKDNLKDPIWLKKTHTQLKGIYLLKD